MKFEWEHVKTSLFDDYRDKRAKIHGGWIFIHDPTDKQEMMIFIPDPNHEWILENEQE